MNEVAIHSENQASLSEHVEMLEVLMRKREQLLTELRKNDTSMAKLQKEYSVKLNKIKEEQRPVQDALLHVEALLELEGWEKSKSPDIADTDKSATIGPISYIDAAHKLLEDVGQPMHYRTMYSKLKENGIYIPGNDPAATLLVKMSRDVRFKRIPKRGTYALSFWRIAAAKSKSRASRKKSR